MVSVKAMLFLFRMYPVAPGLGRTLAKDTSLAGYIIPAGVSMSDIVTSRNRHAQNIRFS